VPAGGFAGSKPSLPIFSIRPSPFGYAA